MNQIVGQQPNQACGPLLSALQDLDKATDIREALSKGQPVMSVSKAGVQRKSSPEDAQALAQQMEARATAKVYEALMPRLAAMVGGTVAALMGKVQEGSLVLSQDDEGRWQITEPAIRAQDVH